MKFSYPAKVNDLRQGKKRLSVIDEKIKKQDSNDEEQLVEGQ